MSELQRLDRKQHSEAVFVKLRAVIADQLSIKPEKIIPSARFVEDLEVDGGRFWRCS